MGLSVSRHAGGDVEVVVERDSHPVREPGVVDGDRLARAVLEEAVVRRLPLCEVRLRGMQARQRRDGVQVRLQSCLGKPRLQRPGARGSRHDEGSKLGNGGGGLGEHLSHCLARIQTSYSK